MSNTMTALIKRLERAELENLRRVCVSQFLAIERLTLERDGAQDLADMWADAWNAVNESARAETNGAAILVRVPGYQDGVKLSPDEAYALAANLMDAADETVQAMVEADLEVRR